jgi:hypothetical protein
VLSRSCSLCRQLPLRRQSHLLLLLLSPCQLQQYGILQLLVGLQRALR